MKKFTKIALAASAALLFASQAQAAYDIKKKIGAQDTKLSIYGFSQLEARGGDGILGDDSDAIAKFQAQRIRLGMNYTAGKVRGKLFLDFNQNHDDAKTGEAGIPKVVKDAFVSYVVDNSLAIKVGLIKMPHGMSFTIPGWNLDIVERGFDKKLALERNTGIMLSGRAIGGKEGQKVNGFEMGHERPWEGFGYDIMIANQAGRSGAVKDANPGNNNSYAARVMYDAGEVFHSELSYAVSKEAGGDGSADYKSLNFGLDSHFGASNLKFEMYMSENLKGVDGTSMDTYAFTGTHYVTDTVELALKHIHGTAESGDNQASIGNTYIGANFYISAFDNKMTRSAKRKRNAHRMQFNYVLATGDSSAEWKAASGIGGYTDDAWLFQYQYKF